MPDLTDLEAGLRSVARQLDGMSPAVDPDQVMGTSRPAGRPGARRLAAVAAAAMIAGGALLATQLRSTDEAVTTTGRASESGVAGPATSTTDRPTDASSGSYTGTPFDQLPAAGIAVVEGDRAVLLDHTGAELASARTPAIATITTQPGLGTFAVRPGGQVDVARVEVAEAPPGCDGGRGAGGIRVALCGGDLPSQRNQVVVVTPAGTAKVVIHEAPGSRGVGHWRWAIPSPDGRWVLAQWSGECESPAAFVVATDGSEVRAVDGQRDLQSAAESIGAGWTPDGRAVVGFGKGLCGRAVDTPGTYLVDPATSRRTLIRPTSEGSSGPYLWSRRRS